MGRISSAFYSFSIFILAKEAPQKVELLTFNEGSSTKTIFRERAPNVSGWLLIPFLIRGDIPFRIEYFP